LVPLSFPRKRIKLMMKSNHKCHCKRTVRESSCQYVYWRKSTALNSAIAAATRAGVVCVVAAGNENVCRQFMSNDEADMK
jgi:hypothetical protein